MAKELICVYQDCVMCGDRGKKLKKYVEVEGIELRKVSFASEEGKELIHEALAKHGIGTMPFYTDGNRFTTNIYEFSTENVHNIQEMTATSKKTTKKRRNVKKTTKKKIEARS